MSKKKKKLDPAELQKKKEKRLEEQNRVRRKELLSVSLIIFCAVILITAGLIALVKHERSAYDTIVFKVGDETVRKDEVNLCILQNVVDLGIDREKLDASADKLKDNDTKNADEYYKTEILRLIMDYKIESMIAERRGITLTEDEEQSVRKDVTDYLGRTNARVLNELGISRERINEIYRQRYLAYKLVEKTKAETNADTGDKKFSTIYLMLFPKIETTEEGGFVTDEEDGSLILLTDDEIAKRKEDAEKAYKELTEDNASPDDVAEKYGVSVFSGERSDFTENFDEPFSEIVSGLKVGECSDVIEIDSCFAIIKMIKENNEELVEKVLEQYQKDAEQDEIDNKKKEWYEELGIDDNPEFIGNVWNNITLYDFIKYVG